ncbi:MAG: cation transporter [Nitrospinae bacterium]|nr:cation transporter [Nitrospinota bacterium]
MRYQECIPCSRRVGWIGLLASGIFAVAKFVVGYVAGSKALMVDSLYSTKDMFTSILIITGMKISQKPADKAHHYGHGKIEFLLSLAASIVFMGLTVFLFFHTLDILGEEEHNIPHGISIFVALIATLANYKLYRFTKCVDREIPSPMVQLLSHHTEADAFSSLIVGAGVAYEHFFPGIPMDTYIAIIECLHLFYLGLGTFIESIKGLMDSAMPEGQVQFAQRLAKQIEGVMGVYEIKSRRVGSHYFLNIVIGVDPNLTIQEARTVSETVEKKIKGLVGHVRDVKAEFRGVVV